MIKFKHIFKPYRIILIGLTFIFTISLSQADQDLISLFPLNNYDQTVSTWINSNDPQFDKPLLNEEMQQKRFNIFYEHYFGIYSPWNADYVNQILHQNSPDDLQSIELSLINYFSNEGKSDNQIGYGENFRPYDKNWINGIANNINISHVELTYESNHRGIAIDNLHARALPTEDVHFYSHKLAGQGYPFDNLQMSALWAGTPVYIVCESKDHAWMLVITPDYIGWVKSNGIARVDNAFVDSWIKAAKNQLTAITQTQTSLVDDKGKFLLLAYVGSVFPASVNSNNSTDITIMVPVADAERNAVIKYAMVSNQQAVFMPIAVTPQHFLNIMTSMAGRPYGWGSMYFYNDCSAELKSLFTPFGIWLPRHSSYQVNAGRIVDMTSSSPEERLSYLMKNGHRFLTLIYIGGHVVMYMGNYFDPHHPDSLMAMTYQNIWGLTPNPAIRRAVIGRSVLFPMLLQYPEDPSLISLANKKFFQVSYLDQLPVSDSNLMLKKGNRIDIKALMYPEMNNLIIQ